MIATFRDGSAEQTLHFAHDAKVAVARVLIGAQSVDTERGWIRDGADLVWTGRNPCGCIVGTFTPLTLRYALDVLSPPTCEEMRRRALRSA